MTQDLCFLHSYQDDTGDSSKQIETSKEPIKDTQKSKEPITDDTHIVEDMRTELDSWNVGGNLYKAGCVLDDIKAANESFLGKLQYLSGTNKGEYGQAQENSED